MSKLISFNKVSYSLPSGEVMLNEVSFHILEGNFYNLISPQKSILTQLMAGLKTHHAGEVTILNQDVSVLSAQEADDLYQEISLISAEIPLLDHLTLLENV